jgi:hypothetical protein
VVCASIGDVSKFVQDGIGGFVVPNNDDSILAERIGTVIGTKDLCPNMGKSHVQSRSGNLDWTGWYQRP